MPRNVHAGRDVKMAGTAVLPLTCDGQSARRHGAADTPDDGVEDCPPRLTQQSHDFVYASAECSRLYWLPVSPQISMRGLSRVEGFIMPLRCMVARRTHAYRVQSSSLRTSINEFVTRFVVLLRPARASRHLPESSEALSRVRARFCHVALDLDVPRPVPGCGDVVSGLHPQQRVHLRAERLFDPQRHVR
jgi:hypothetical protein